MCGIIFNSFQIFVSGKKYDCLSNGIDLIAIQQDEFQETSNANNLNNNWYTESHSKRYA